MCSSDLNSDDVADRVLIIQDISSSDPSSIEMERSSNGEWIVNPGSSESSSSGTFEIPSQFLPALSPDAPLQQQIAERFDLEFAKNAAALWQAAYPGQPWPSDDITGEPYAPVVLVGVVAHDETLSRDQPQLVDYASKAEAQWDSFTNGIISQIQ